MSKIPRCVLTHFFWCRCFLAIQDVFDGQVVVAHKSSYHRSTIAIRIWWTYPDGAGYLVVVRRQDKEERQRGRIDSNRYFPIVFVRLRTMSTACACHRSIYNYLCPVESVISHEKCDGCDSTAQRRRRLLRVLELTTLSGRDGPI